MLQSIPQIAEQIKEINLDVDVFTVLIMLMEGQARGEVAGDYCRFASVWIILPYVRQVVNDIIEVKKTPANT